jgi:predicted amino acid racemase
MGLPGRTHAEGSAMRVVADTAKIAANTEAIVRLCAGHDIDVVGVSKCVRGEPEIVKAMLQGGVRIIGESRLVNIRRIREAGIECAVMLLRLPALSEAEDVVHLAQYSLNSEAEVIRALSAAAIASGRRHGVLVSVETGDRREGVMPEEAAALCRLVLDLPGLDLAGVATSLNCLCGVLPTVENQEAFAQLVESLQQDLGLEFPMVSAGHTGNLHLVMKGQVPACFNQLRIGEAILFGTDTTTDADLPTPYRDAFKIYAEVVELKEKPSAPGGEVGVDAFMRVHEWPDLGLRRRATLSMGELDAGVQFMRPTLAGTFVVGASSDHLVVDVTDAAVPIRVGDELEFVASYNAIAYGWSSCYATRRVS